MSYVPIAVLMNPPLSPALRPSFLSAYWNDALAALTTGQIGQLRITEKRAAHVSCIAKRN